MSGERILSSALSFVSNHASVSERYTANVWSNRTKRVPIGGRVLHGRCWWSSSTLFQRMTDRVRLGHYQGAEIGEARAALAAL